MGTIETSSSTSSPACAQHFANPQKATYSMGAYKKYTGLLAIFVYGYCFLWPVIGRPWLLADSIRELEGKFLFVGIDAICIQSAVAVLLHAIWSLYVFALFIKREAIAPWHARCFVVYGSYFWILHHVISLVFWQGYPIGVSTLADLQRKFISHSCGGILLSALCGVFWMLYLESSQRVHDYFGENPKNPEDFREDIQALPGLKKICHIWIEHYHMLICCSVVCFGWIIFALASSLYDSWLTS